MLGTVSGYVNPHNAAVKYISLIEFFKDEILREFKEETGFDKYANTKDWKKFIKVILKHSGREAYVFGPCV